MKALELLKADRDYCQSINNDKSIIEQYNEAIKELEDLQNRSCENCLYFSNSGYGFGLCNKGVSSDFKTGTFCCNKWESK